ncbi:hypothetical protein [Rhodococcus aetherivorans]|uniref:hypothetical protein n=1 Tax=Rhodococcus aetherivorans TaxID=191292 RepID=UPI001E61C914|nr:hypothetical protein [Rhodococcus aetherivorans]UGQ39898.1 hypothetical protein LRQ66_17100 [Rhodococcus aetherivorans]
MTASFAPIRPTAVRYLRPGDHIIVPTEGPGAGIRGVITDLQENEAERLITINGEVDAGEGLFYHHASPHEVVNRLILPSDPVPGNEMIMVKGTELWKWIGESMNDPHGSSEQYTIRTFAHISDPETGEPAVEIKMVSQLNPRKILTAHLTPNATIGFAGCR